MKKTLIISTVIGLIATMALASGAMATNNNDGCTVKPGAVYEEGIGNGSEATRLMICDVVYPINTPPDRIGCVSEEGLPGCQREVDVHEVVILTRAAKGPMFADLQLSVGKGVTMAKPGVVLEEGIGGPATRLWIGGFNGPFEPEEPIGGFNEEGSNSS